MKEATKRCGTHNTWSGSQGAHNAAGQTEQPPCASHEAKNFTGNPSKLISTRKQQITYYRPDVTNKDVTTTGMGCHSLWSRGSSRPRDRTQVSCIASRLLPSEPPGKPQHYPVQKRTSVELLIHVRVFATPWIAAHQPGLPVHHQLPEFTYTHAHRVGNAIQPSHPLSHPSPPAPNPSQHQSLFQWVNSSHEVAKVLKFQLQHQSFQWTPRTDLLKDGLIGSPCSPRDYQESSPTPQFKSINSPVLSFLHSPTLTSIHDHWNNHSLD